MVNPIDLAIDIIRRGVGFVRDVGSRVTSFIGSFIGVKKTTLGEAVSGAESKKGEESVKEGEEAKAEEKAELEEELPTPEEYLTEYNRIITQVGVSREVNNFVSNLLVDYSRLYRLLELYKKDIEYLSRIAGRLEEEKELKEEEELEKKMAKKIYIYVVEGVVGLTYSNRDVYFEYFINDDDYVSLDGFTDRFKIRLRIEASDDNELDQKFNEELINALVSLYEDNGVNEEISENFLIDNFNSYFSHSLRLNTDYKGKLMVRRLQSKYGERELVISYVVRPKPYFSNGKPTASIFMFSHTISVGDIVLASLILKFQIKKKGVRDVIES